MKKNKLYLFTGNHKSLLGISDHISIIKEVLDKHDFEIEIVEDIIPNKVNLFIEEQSNNKVNNLINKTKKLYPKTKFVMVLTEFPTKIKNKISYNEFEKNSILFPYFKFTYNLINPIIEYINYKRIITTINNLNFKFLNNTIIFIGRILIKTREERKNKRGYLTSLLVKLNVYYKKIKTWLKPILKLTYIYNFYYIVYMEKRANGTKQIKESVDLHLSVHPSINERALKYFKIQSYTIFPLVKNFNTNILFNNSNKIIHTGRDTPERLAILKNLSTKLLAINSKYQFINIGFISENKIINNVCGTINIPQSIEWKFSSPVRTFRSIKRNHIPFVTNYFNDHPIEKLNVLLKDENIYDIEKLISNYYKNINDKINEYCTLANDNNNIYVNKLLKFYDETKNLTIEEPIEFEDKIPPKLIGTLFSNNIVKFNKKFYIIDEKLGNLKIENLNIRNDNERIILFDNFDEAATFATKIQKDSFKLIGHIFGYNIIYHESSFITLDRSVGDINIQKINLNKKNKGIKSFNNCEDAIIFATIKGKDNYIPNRSIDSLLDSQSDKSTYIPIEVSITNKNLISNTPILVGKMDEYNIVSYKNIFYLLGSMDGNVDLVSDNEDNLINKYFNCKTINEIIFYINAPSTANSPHKIGSFFKKNIIVYNHKFYILSMNDNIHKIKYEFEKSYNLMDALYMANLDI